ncbi:MAG: hypothetical protein M3N19_03660 [Candidatus Eremiobacteraeota bacterium]|nr:hypothetical protein [Candidatus Eremiobacteraeota bacterium]
MSTGFDWSIILDAGVGIGVLLAGLGVFLGMRALAGTLGRVNVTLDEVDRQIAGVGVPVTQMLSHIGGIADTADSTVARLGGVVKSLEDVAGSVAGTAKLTQDAVSPALVNVGATLSGVTAGLRRLVNGKTQSGPTEL